MKCADNRKIFTLSVTLQSHSFDEVDFVESFIRQCIKFNFKI